MRRLAILFCLLLLAPLAHAGPWPREKGRIFLATSTEIGDFRLDERVLQSPFYSSLYLEYGLTDRLTLGAHGGYGSQADPDGRLFLRLPIGRHDTHRVAIEVTGGTAGWSGERPFYGLGLHYGRGFELWNRAGWFSAETRMEWQMGSGRMKQAKLDLTLGLSFDNGVKPMVQLHATRIGTDLYARLVPGLAIPLWKNTTLDTGALIDLTHGKSTGVKIGLWQEF